MSFLLRTPSKQHNVGMSQKIAPGAAKYYLSKGHKVPYDLFCNSVANTVNDCGIYFPSKAARSRHNVVHKRPDRNPTNPEDEDAQVDAVEPNPANPEPIRVFRNLFEAIQTPWMTV